MRIAFGWYFKCQSNYNNYQFVDNKKETSDFIHSSHLTFVIFVFTFNLDALNDRKGQKWRFHFSLKWMVVVVFCLCHTLFMRRAKQLIQISWLIEIDYSFNCAWHHDLVKQCCLVEFCKPGDSINICVWLI